LNFDPDNAPYWKPRTTKVKPFFLKKRGGGKGVRDYAPPVNSPEFLVKLSKTSKALELFTSVVDLQTF